MADRYLFIKFIKALVFFNNLLNVFINCPETRGTDITEAFESAHVDMVKTKSILAKYFVRDIATPRKSKFTFAPDGFYSTLRERYFLPNMTNDWI